MRTQTGWAGIAGDGGDSPGTDRAPGRWLRRCRLDRSAAAQRALGTNEPARAAPAERVVPPFVAGNWGAPLDYDVPAEGHHSAFPVPLYHDRPETGGFFVASEFIFYRQTNPIGNQTIAVRGLVDADGDLLAALGGPGAVAILPCQQLFPGCGLVGNFIGSAREALNSNQAGGESYAARLSGNDRLPLRRGL